ncbi:hypothetical protein D3C71_1595340 [compost metagenome]
MVGHQHPRHGEDGGLFEGLDDEMTGQPLVVLLHFPRGEQAGAGDLAVEVVGLGGAENRNSAPRLGPGGGVGGVGVHHAAKFGIGAIEHQVGGGVGGGAQGSFHLLAREIQHHHVLGPHPLVADAARLYHHQTLFPVYAAHVAPGEGHQTVARQIQVGGEHLLLEDVEAHASAPRL